MAGNDLAKIACQFKFKCPKVWHLLDPTPEADIRFCPACEREVYLAKTEAEFHTHAAQGHCVAVPVISENQLDDPGRENDDPQDEDQRPASYILGKADVPYNYKTHNAE